MKRTTITGSNQLSLGQLIKEIEKCGKVHGDENKPKLVSFDFGSAIPTTLDSYRGFFNELALGYKLTGYDNDKEHMAEISVETLLSDLAGATASGKTFYGWKGGNYAMSEDTPVWVSNPGNADHTAVVGVIDRGWMVVILTAFCE